MSGRRVVVLGAGAVGGSIAALLSAAGVPVKVVARGAHLAAIRSGGLRLRCPDGASTHRLDAAATVDEVDWRPGDLALLATKLNDAEEVLDQLLQAAGPTVPVVCATNGLAAERWAGARFETVLSMLVWLPATHLVPGEIRLHSAPCRGVLDTGPAGELCDALCSDLREAGFEAQPRDDILHWKRAKLLTNLGGAAQALVADDWLDVAQRAQSEGARIFERLGVEHVSVETLLERCASVRQLPIDGQEREGGSTWQSFRRGKPLESIHLEGELARIARDGGLDAPLNAALAAASEDPREARAREFPSG